ncbi:hypothetical protein GCM10027413_02910 [Conyzicola nivalis]|uniref:Uncharacterized protein n=1 Tax=Conyzicola nivalis TaxID=1477021 RepID=A0A916SQJ5_9MICO|nr:hypothetical protein [Conyzicola nivalis]GGB08439.1 hypothetical protein GCM10010979_23730 [Conyzicola nivalis]
MAQVEIATVPYTVSADYFAEVGADFDTGAVDDAVLAQLNLLLPAGVVVHRNGKAYADEDAAESARQIDWTALLAGIDVDQILADNAK